MKRFLLVLLFALSSQLLAPALRAASALKDLSLLGTSHVTNGATLQIDSGGALVLASGSSLSLQAGSVPWSALSGKPTTLAGYGITDGVTASALSSQLSALASVYQPLDSDLSSIASLATTSFGRGLLTEASASTLKSTLSLNLVDNTSDAAKPISTAAATALAGKEPTIAAGTSAQYWRGDKTWQSLTWTAVASKPTTLAGYGITDPIVVTSGTYADPAWITSLAKSKVGLGSVDNTSDAAKPISTAASTALAGKEPTIAAGTTAQYWRGDKTWQALPAATTGASGVVQLATTAQALAGTSSTLIAPVSANEARILNGDINRANAPCLYSDGATNNRRVEWTPGPAGAVAGLPLTIPFEFDVPTNNPATDGEVFSVGPSATGNSSSAWALSLRLRTDGSLTLRQNGATTGDARVFQSATTFRTTYAGGRIRGAIVLLGDSVTTPAVYVQGADISAIFTASWGANGSATAPNWMPSAIDGSKYIVGYNWPVGRFVPHAPIVGAVSAAAVLGWTQTGRWEEWCEVLTGSAADPSASTFANRGAPTNDLAIGSNGFEFFTSSSATGFSAQHSGTNGSVSQATKGGYNGKIGTRWRVRFTLTVNAGAKPTQIGLATSAASGTINASANIASSVNVGTNDFYIDATADFSAGGFTFINASTDGTNDFSVSNFSLTPFGPVFRPIIQPIGVVGDWGTNKLCGLLAPGITPITDKRDWSITFTTSTNGNQQALGGATFMNPNTNRVDSWVINNAGTSKTVSLGNASGGSQYASGITVGAGLNDVTLLTRFNATTSFWVSSNGTDVLTHTITGHKVD